MFDFLLSNPWIILAIISPIILFLGIVLGNFFSQPRKNRVLKVSPESKRGVELVVKSEDTVSVFCNPVGKMPPQKFIKQLHPFNIIKKGFFKLHSYALWIGRYGTAYVHKFDNKPAKKTLKEVVFHIFGEKYYNQIPQEQKTQIESGEIGVTIEFPKDPLTPKGLPSISEDDVNRDTDEKAMRNLWAAYDKEMKSSYIDRIPWIGVGVAVGLILSLVFKWGAPVILPT